MMSLVIPITLSGNNLGERHRHFNSLVRNVYQQEAPLQHILQLPESSPLDKLFKIELASKHRNVDFILNVLKDEDMLCISKALKCTWLLQAEYQNIINPDYLEMQLYPYMITPAVNKMKHWVENNLKDAKRCQEFYKYYDSDFHTKIKFLYHCTSEFIMAEFLNIIDKVTPKHLKILCERFPKLLKLYYDNMIENSAAMERYLKNEHEYIDCSKYILKVEPEIYFEVIEKFYHYEYKPLPPGITDFIMSNHKERFSYKRELYAARILHRGTLAKYLNNDEAKDLVLLLARAEYLSNWFSYKNVEPFIKKIKADERSAFKKRVFVNKEIGATVTEWPYPTPCRLKMQTTETLFDDVIHRQLFIYEQKRLKRCLKKRKMCRAECFLACPIEGRKTILDELFDRYRFHGFDRTLFELQKLLRAESSVKNREFMMLVLVSKCGENMDQVERLLRLLSEHYANESTNLRATIVRSFVVRARIWRLKATAWSLLLHFARGLGLDGSSPITCREGMHAAVLRVLLSGEECPQSLCSAFLDNFSNFTEYKLNTVEKRAIRERLPALLLTTAAAEPDLAVERLQLLLDTLQELKVQVKDCPGALEVLIKAVRLDPSLAENLLIRMYNRRVARRELIKENFDLFKTNESYLNVLRHDATILKTTNNFEESLKTHSFNYDWFLRKLSLYFGEKNGLALLHAEAVKSIAEKEPHVTLARPLALLRTDLRPIIEECKCEPKDSPKKQFGTALQSNYCIKRLADVDAVDWNSISAKAIVNRIIICRAIEVGQYIEKSLECRRTLKLALLLAERGGNLPRVYEAVRVKRPGAAMRAAISYFNRNQGDKVQIDVWRKVAPALDNIDMSLQQNYQLVRILQKGEFIPPNIQAEYWTDVFKALQRASKEKAIPVISMFENLLPEINSDIIKEVIDRFLESFTLEAVTDTYYDAYYNLQVRIIAKHLLLCRTESEQKERLDSYWQPFYDRLAVIMKKDYETATLYLEQFVAALKYNRAFFDTTLVSPMSVFEKIVRDLRKLLPMKGFIDIFVTIHAVMLYRNSIEQVLKLKPEVFKDITSKRIDGAWQVGHLFGKFVGHEIKELVTRYFKTVINPYQRHLARFLMEEFRDEGHKLSNAFIKGLIDVGSTEALRIAEYILKQDQHSINKDPERTDLLKMLNESKDEELKFFLYADFHSGGLTEAG